jgi:hypothetical protein
VIEPSTAARVAIWPRQTYAELHGEGQRGSWWRAAAIPLVTALVIGVSTSVAATGVASLFSIASGALCWSFVPLIQLANGLLLCRRPPRGSGGTARAVELFFLSHLPWSLWLIGITIVLLWVPLAGTAIYQLLLTAVVPLIWTGAILRSFCQTVLGCSAHQASRRTLNYLAITLFVIFVYVFLAVGLWPRIVGAMS